MPCRIPQRKRETIKVKLGLDQSVKTIAKNNNVSASAVYNYRRNLRDHGTLRPPKTVHQGRPQKITQQMQEVHSYDVIVAENINQSSLFSITFLNVLLCTSMSRFTIYGIPSMSMSMSRLCNAC